GAKVQSLRPLLQRPFQARPEAAQTLLRRSLRRILPGKNRLVNPLASRQWHAASLARMYPEPMTNFSRQPIPDLPWFDVDDPASPALDELAKRFGLHPLEIEDCRNRPQRAKLEEYPSHVFIVLKHLLHS